MKEPFQSDDALIADIEGVRRRAGAVDFWWLGQSGFLVHHRGRWVLIDPYLSDSLTRKYANTDKPHVRMTRQVIEPGVLASRIWQPVSVTSSHAHTDHLDPETLRRLSVDKFIAPRAILETAMERCRDPRTHTSPVFEGADDGSRHQIGPGIVVHGIASAHEQMDRDSAGRCKYLGFVFEFFPALEASHGHVWAMNKEFTIYHSGDTILYDGLIEKLRPFKVDVALLPINGRAPERRVAGNLTGKEAALLAKKIRAKLVIPCHYDMFEFNTASPEEFIAECERLKQPYRVLGQGERWSSLEGEVSLASRKK